MLAAFAACGVDVVGIDSSPQMVALAGERVKRYVPRARELEADMRSFALAQRTFGGAFCPVNTVAHLPDRESLVLHLRCMAAHLRPGSRYLVQVEMRDPKDPWAGVGRSTWEAERGA